ncbi:MAG: thioredoxin family protein [Candidatus Pseudobacter hemicellulosilyticus]|uniref:Thioredoxin family protein n=1 Tax=Candidatus Pseudobacter hemicellulosilyticus TaxID=3121375 RepID=A0AAJ5WTC9_9BACT|nr:MAG: thioredoxin family protein [Pseudobacter sp.]
MQTWKAVILCSWAAIFSCAVPERRIVDKAMPEEARGAGQQVVLASQLSQPEGPVGEKMKWLSLQEAAAALAKEKKPVLIDLYTDWCGWCKVMDKRTYGHAKVSAYVQEHFYPVKIDAESKQTFSWNGREFSYNSGNKVNDLAIWLTGGQLSFPTTVFIPVGGEPQAIPGFLPPNEFELLAKYFGEDHFGKTDFVKYRQQFKSSW